MEYRIRQRFQYEPTPEQVQAMKVFCDFVTEGRPQSAMILRGSAGTGKTSLAGAFVRTLAALGKKVVLLAPTGRAAKVFSLNSGHPAFTIHRKIYRQKTFTGDMSGFSLNDNLHSDTLFIVDEASMISNGSAMMDHAAFGSGNLLDDLIQFVYQGNGCRLLFIGDKAQLPPVGKDESPALLRDVVSAYGLRIYEADLSVVLRQAKESGILWNATMIRRLLMESGNGYLPVLPKISFHGFPDIHVVPGDELVEQLNTSYSRVGIDETIVITRSNKRANVYNQGIRNTILDSEEPLNRTDQLMVVKNNYYWSDKREVINDKFSNEKDSSLITHHSSLPFIANGDRCQVLRMRNIYELYGFHFAEATLLFPDYDDLELDATVLLDTLTAEAPALTREQSDQLFQKVLEDYADIPKKTDRMKAVRNDRHYNALQIKYAYAVTCHKAQGGQWAHVYIDQGYMNDDMLTPDYIHWLYTAFTRATEQLYLVNWPSSQMNDNPTN